MSMVNTLFAVAEMQEAKPIIEHYNMRKLSVIQGINLWANNKNNRNNKIMLIVTGVGINNVISSLSKALYFEVIGIGTLIINVGYAGAKGIDIGKVVCVKNSHCLEFPTKANTGIINCVELSSEEEGYDCYTSFDFVEKTKIEGKALFDMELAYIARFVYCKLYSIKIVSDNLDYNTFKEFNSDKAWRQVIEKIEKIRKENGIYGIRQEPN